MEVLVKSREGVKFKCELMFLPMANRFLVTYIAMCIVIQYSFYHFYRKFPNNFKESGKCTLQFAQKWSKLQGALKRWIIGNLKKNIARNPAVVFLGAHNRPVLPFQQNDRDIADSLAVWSVKTTGMLRG